MLKETIKVILAGLADKLLLMANRLVDKSGDNYRIYIPVATIGITRKRSIEPQDANLCFDPCEDCK